MRLRMICCEMLFREMCQVMARSPHRLDAEFLPKALHDAGANAMRTHIQQRIDAPDAVRCDAILLGYALCGNGLSGIEARETPVVIPRAHDCIALLLGSSASYAELLAENAGTYFRSPGWVERGGDVSQLGFLGIEAGREREALIEKYGEENGAYLFEELYRYRRRYSRLVYIDTGVDTNGDTKQRAAAEAANKGWTFEPQPGSLRWFEKLVNGEWDDDFLVLQPGQRSLARYDSAILHAEAPLA